MITTIASGASLELGAGAQILTDGGERSALHGLTENDGTLVLHSVNPLFPLPPTTGLTNTGTFNIDTGAGDGGSGVVLGGTLTNDGTLDIGNASLTSTTNVIAEALTNSGSIALAGGRGRLAASAIVTADALTNSGSIALAKSGSLVVDGAAATSGDLTIGLGAEFNVTGSDAFTQAGGSTTVTGSLVASTIDANDGLLDFKSAISGGDGVGALNIGSTGTLEFDAAVDSSHGVDFATAGGTLALGDAGAFSGTVSNFAVSDAINLLGQTITNLAYSGSSTSGVLTVNGSSGTIAELSFAGDYMTSSFTFSGSKILHT